MRLGATMLLALLAGCAVSATDAPVQGRVAYVNGEVFDGESFAPRALVVEGGRIIAADPTSAAERVDLQGGYVVPPFCEAHNHNLGSADENQEAIDRYLSEGIFYVGTLSNLPAFTDPVRHTYNIPHSVDTIFGNGGLTASGGHPIRLRESLLERGVYPGFTRETLADHSYFVVDNEADLERKWALITSFRPDFIKIFLLWSEEFDARRDDANFFGQKGLDPALVPRIVERAHAEGLRVFAHVESAHDFHVAVSSGVDVIAHLPGNDGPAEIDPADARLAAERGISVMTTTVLIERPARRRDAERYQAMRDAQIANLRLLRDAGVTLAAGSDEVRQTSSAEIAHLRGLGVFDNAGLLRMWSRDCSRTLFPERQLGELRSGFEASFLVLGADPLANFDATTDIRMRIKDGEVLQVAAPSAESP
jgi:imidazolonepropionase-like amidohydrolase